MLVLLFVFAGSQWGHGRIHSDEPETGTITVVSPHQRHIRCSSRKMEISAYLSHKYSKLQ